MKKLIFGQNLNIKDINYIGDEQEFITKSIDEDQKLELNKLNEKRQKIAEKYFKIVKTIAGIFIVFAFISLILTMVLQNGNNELLAIFWYISLFLTGLSVLIFIVVTISLKKKFKSPEMIEINEKMQELYEEMVKSVDMPNDVIKMDFIIIPYTVKDEKIEFNGFINIDTAIWKEDNKLKIFAGDRLVSIPLNNFESIKKVSEKAELPRWNKQSKPQEGEFAKYNIKMKNYKYIIQSYYIVSIQSDLEAYELFLPDYEAQTFIDITGLDYKE